MAMTRRDWLRLVAGAGALGAIVAAAHVRFDVDAASLEAKYATPPSRFVTAAGIRFHIRERGQGPVLVLLHGQAINLYAWEPAAKLLAADHRVISLDLPGHGLTGPDPQGRYTLAQMAESIDALMGVLGVTRFALAGNSLGGGVALRYALAHPDKLDALILVDAVGGPATSPGPLAFRLQGARIIGDLMQWFTPQWTVRLVLADTFGDPRKMTDGEVDSTYDLLLRSGNRAAERQTMLGALDPEIATRLGEIATPTLVLWGNRDTWIGPDDARWFGAHLRNADVTILDGLGHMPMLEDPPAATAAMEAFLHARGA
jgi:pimeloyl-ACP methyl ester carboxylesterase